MENNIQTPSQPSKLLLTPLLISMAGIVSTALALLAYRYIVTRFCISRSQIISEENPSHQFPNGVDHIVLESIPILSYSNKERKLFRVDQSECAICLSELQEGNVVRLLPNCGHAFHLHCIDEWFTSHCNCPVCRSPVVATISPDFSVPVGGNGDSNDHNLGMRSNGLLRHSGSLMLPSERKSSILPVRSLSMDHHSCVSVKIRIDEMKSSSRSSSSSSMLMFSRL